MEELPDPPTHSAVRSVLRILAEKGQVAHREDGPRYVYLPAVNTAGPRGGLRHVVSTFSDGSAEQAVTALLRMSTQIDEAAVDELRARVKRERDRAVTVEPGDEVADRLDLGDLPRLRARAGPWPWPWPASPAPLPLFQARAASAAICWRMSSRWPSSTGSVDRRSRRTTARTSPWARARRT